ncbi:alpha/beta fold hydrolase [Polaromonas sp. SM01]|uniref:alpha/beta fold hydrolase n=1 Tax=Polaromonas sp. SM01 TaxID=3085630 RepID=UPI0029819811|nr:alpha/beta fold hydrolase [Polaromonas sp. SM01]MDW5441789.1 alpha/beta fold hydrolase [Polaromonas sp. SM01]
MAPKQDIRFCTTSDGVRLATATTGEGPPLIRVGTWLTHLECDAREPDSWAAIEEFSRDHTYVRYDSRGCGLSDRRIPPLQFEDLVVDLAAVVDAHSQAPLPLYGLSCGAPVAIAYAARHPERVSRLILLNGFGRAYFSAKHPEPALLEEANLLLSSARVGWNNEKSVFRQVFVSQLLGNATSEMRRGIDERMRLSMTPEMAEQYLRRNYEMDVKAECARLKCPVLVLHARGDQMVGFEQGRKLAGWIAGARFVPLESDSHVLLGGAPAALSFFAEMRAFLGVTVKAGASTAKLSPRQSEILACVAHGQTDKQIARELGLSPRTVEMHVAGAMKALSCTTRAQAVHRATSEGLLAT